VLLIAASRMHYIFDVSLVTVTAFKEFVPKLVKYSFHIDS
jgi:hypothetical protein